MSTRLDSLICSYPAIFPKGLVEGRWGGGEGQDLGYRGTSGTKTTRKNKSLAERRARHAWKVKMRLARTRPGRLGGFASALSTHLPVCSGYPQILPRYPQGRGVEEGPGGAPKEALEKPPRYLVSTPWCAMSVHMLQKAKSQQGAPNQRARRRKGLGGELYGASKREPIRPRGIVYLS